MPVTSLHESVFLAVHSPVEYISLCMNIIGILLFELMFICPDLPLGIAE